LFININININIIFCYQTPEVSLINRSLSYDDIYTIIYMYFLNYFETPQADWKNSGRRAPLTLRDFQRRPGFFKPQPPELLWGPRASKNI